MIAMKLRPNLIENYNKDPRMSDEVMNILREYVPPVALLVLVIGGLVAARLTRHRPLVLSRALMINAMCGCCFAGGFLRAGWDKALAAFLVIFVIASLFSVGRWIEYRHYQSTLPSKQPSEKAQP